MGLHEGVFVQESLESLGTSTKEAAWQRDLNCTEMLGKLRFFQSHLTSGRQHKEVFTRVQFVSIAVKPWCLGQSPSRLPPPVRELRSAVHTRLDTSIVHFLGAKHFPRHRGHAMVVILAWLALSDKTDVPPQEHDSVIT